MQNFHELEITSVTPNTKNAVLVEFAVPENLKDIFKFQAGQHIVFNFNLERNNYRRTYSICSAPQENKLCISVKRQKKGIISNYINDAFFKGFKVNVSQPFGHFYSDAQIISTFSVVLWAGGSGITPMLSIAKHILSRFPNKKVHLIYANNDEQSIMFENEIEHLKGRYSPLFSVQHILSNPTKSNNFFSKLFSFDKPKKQLSVLRGYVNEALIESVTNQFPDAVHYICGPEKMMEICETALSDKNTQSIHLERFTGSTFIKNSHKNAVLKVRLSKEEHQIRLSENTLLDAMLAAKLNPPYACKSGTCGSCKAKLLHGEVITARDFALNEADREAHKILCCQSWAKSSDIEIQF
jgi:ring-1,2-phenylacetyl-CoA epoxidase subunit PaaE